MLRDGRGCVLVGCQSLLLVREVGKGRVGERRRG